MPPGFCDEFLGNGDVKEVQTKEQKKRKCSVFCFRANQGVVPPVADKASNCETRPK